MNTIKHYILSFYNSYLKRFFNRNILTIQLIIILFVLGVFVGKAWADEPAKKGSKPEVFLEAKVRTKSKNLFDSTTTSTTTTTTTTTTKPVVLYKKPAKTTSTTTVPTPETNVPPVTQAPTYSGSHSDWMTQAGIPESDWSYVEFIVSREGGWEPCKINGGAVDCNYQGNRAYGMVQALPGSKMAVYGDDWRTNPVTQLKFLKAYCDGRYGSLAGAVAFWQKNHWY